MRSRLRCTREDLPEVEWDHSHVFQGFGRAEDHSLAGTRIGGLPVNWQYPPEDPRDGCPYGLGMGAFVASVLEYQRRRNQDGGRIPNRRYDTLDPSKRPLALDAIHYLEFEQERLAGVFAEAQAEHMRKKAT